MSRALVAVVVAAGSLLACSAVNKAAQEDPMKCERDPKCDKKRGRTMDCSRQCNDDPACMERCEQVQAPNGRLGH
ncbi:MAG: hypothetical protein JST00_05180 [Deltaproteobacteria bacterium]|nr:hypothetical protein [Deltaproteobacteria bacterium]